MSTIAERLSAVDTKLNNILTNANTQLTNKGKTAVSDLSDLPSAVGELKNPTGSISITQNGTVDVSNYASANVNVPTPTPSLQSKSIEVTENGTQTITPDSGYDGLNEVEVTTNVSGSGGKNVQFNNKTKVSTYTSYFNGMSLTVNKTGTYKITRQLRRISTSGTWGSQLYINNTAYGTKNTTWGMNYTVNYDTTAKTSQEWQQITEEHISLQEGDIVSVYGRTNGNYLYYIYLLLEEE